MDLSISGLASNFDWKTLVSQLADVERAPQRRLTTEKQQIATRNNAYSSLKTQLAALQTRVTALKDPSFFDVRLASTSSSAVGSAQASAGSSLGSHTFAITQMATTSRLQGASNVGKALTSTTDPVTAAGFPSPVSTGYFTVNGKRIEIDSATTLDTIFTEMASAGVNASYDGATDSLRLSSQIVGKPIVLGGATDTSNFLQAARLSNNGTDTVASSSALGAVKLASPISGANLTTAVTATAGQFKINGVAFDYDASSDSVSDVLTRINNSEAGVTAAYDAVQDKFTLTNMATGNVGISVQDEGTGNLMAAMGLASGTFAPGKDLLYTVDGGGQLSSRTNVITGDTSGVSGVTVSALSEGTMTVTVAADTAKIRTGINDFISEYNKLQSQLATWSASSTDAQGKVTAGLLAGDLGTQEIAANLRKMMTSDVVGITGALKRLDNVGFSSNGNDDTLANTNAGELDKILTSRLNDLKALFTTAGTGLATRVDTFLTQTIGEEGSLPHAQTEFTRQSQSIDKQVAEMERRVVSYQQRLTAQFVAMEAAQQKINQQMQYLSQQNFGR